MARRTSTGNGPGHFTQLQQALAVVLLLALACPAQTTDVKVLLDKAQSLTTGGNREAALLLAWRLETVLLHDKPAPERDERLAAVAQLLQEIDPCLAARRSAAAESARRFLRLADGYRQKKWLDMAAVCLRFAGELDPAAARDSLAFLAIARKAAGARPLDAAALAGTLPFADIPVQQRAGEWWVDQIGTVHSPTLSMTENETAFWLLQKAHDDQEIRCEFYLGPGMAWLDLVFAAKDIDNSCAVGIRRWPQSDLEGITAGVLTDGKWQELALNECALAADADGFHRLVLRVGGMQVDVQLDGVALGTFDYPRQLRGNLGLLVSGNNATRDSMWIRRYSVTQPVAAVGDATSAWFGELLSHAPRARATLKIGEELQRGKQLEAARLWCDAARGDLLALPPGEERTALQKQHDRLAGLADNRHNLWNGVARDHARSLLKLGTQYLAADMPRAAQHLCREAARFDTIAAEARQREVEAALAADLQKQGNAAELAPPPDDGAKLPSWFGDGKALVAGLPAWTLQDNNAQVPLRFGQLSSLVQASPTHCPDARASVQLPQLGMAAGFCFTAVDAAQFNVCCLRRDALGLWLEVRRFAAGQWTTLASRAVDAPGWRLAGWFELHLQVDMNGMLATVGDTQVRANRKQLGDKMLGPFGLFAANGAGPTQTVELRAVKLRG